MCPESQACRREAHEEAELLASGEPMHLWSWKALAGLS